MRRSALTALRALATLVGVWAFVQLLPRWLPEDPARIAVGEWASEAEVQALRHLLRLDLGWVEALTASARELLSGDLGQSLRFHRPVAELLSEGFPVSIRLSLLALVLSAALGWSLALWQSRGSRVVQSVAVASPVYVLGPLLLWIVAFQVPGLPVAGVQGWTSWILPSLALAVPLGGHQARILTAQLEGLQESPGLRWWTGQGVPRGHRWWLWLVPSAAGPWLTVVGLQLGGLLGGAVLTETIFALPGLGSLLVGALYGRDLPLVQGTVLMGAALYVTTQMLVEWATEVLDPRLR